VKYYNGDEVSFGDYVIDTIKLDGTVLEVVGMKDKSVLLTEYNPKTKKEINTLRLSRLNARELISALTQAL
jgi:hypothetical protein